MTGQGFPSHSPVLEKQAVELLVTNPGGVYFDGTVGLGGHSAAILGKLANQGFLIGADLDPESLAIARERLSAFEGHFRLLRGNFANPGEILKTAGAGNLDGALLDLGISSMHFDDPSRGFSIRNEGPLDMRLDRSSGASAADIVNGWPVEMLADLFSRCGEERQARKAAMAIGTRRAAKPIQTTKDLKETLEKALGGRSGRIHPATKCFMALRIEVNRELDNLAIGLEQISNFIKAGGRMVIISFHSLEDRITKNFFRQLCARETWRAVTKKAVCADEEEVRRNPRARSAKLRAVERIR